MRYKIFAVEITLSEIEVDDSGQPVGGRTKLLSHYDGSRTEKEARAIYEACDTLLSARTGEVLLKVATDDERPAGRG